MGPLVTTDWLAGELGKPDLAIFDATKYLPNEPKDGVAEFRRAHIPGARYFDIDQIADPGHGSAAHGADARAVCEAMGELGVATRPELSSTTRGGSPPPRGVRGHGAVRR